MFLLNEFLYLSILSFIALNIVEMSWPPISNYGHQHGETHSGRTGAFVVPTLRDLRGLAESDHSLNNLIP